MTVKAQTWAWSQNIPQKPKFLLVTLADQAEDLCGEVRYKETSTAFFVDKCCITERSFYRCIAALVRQGYVKRESGRGRHRETKYWICLDREPTPLEQWTWGADLDDETQDVEGKSATMAVQETDKICQSEHKNLPSMAEHKDSLDSPKNQGAADEKPIKGFSRQAQDIERAKAVEKFSAKRDPSDIPGWTFVIEGTRWWDLLVKYFHDSGRPMNLIQRGIGRHQGKTGRYMPTGAWEKILKPHSTASPPIAGDGVNEQAVREFAATVNR